MDGERYLEEWELDILDSTVYWFIKGSSVLSRFELDDLKQDCALHWLQVRHTFRPGEGATKETHMRRVLEHKLSDLQEAKLAEKRKGDRKPRSLDEPIEGASGSRFLIDVLPGKSLSTEHAALLELGIERAYCFLEPREVQVCELLKRGCTAVRISVELSVHRDTVNEDLKRIRTVFDRYGLRDLLD